jgi:hypothetical protein
LPKRYMGDCHISWSSKDARTTNSVLVCRASSTDTNSPRRIPSRSSCSSTFAIVCRVQLLKLAFGWVERF